MYVPLAVTVVGDPANSHVNAPKVSPAGKVETEQSVQACAALPPVARLCIRACEIRVPVEVVVAPV